MIGIFVIIIASINLVIGCYSVTVESLVREVFRLSVNEFDVNLILILLKNFVNEK